MADMSAPWAGDLSLDETGDILGVTGAAELEERVIRRALTNAYVAPGTSLMKPTSADYIWNQTYGGNLRNYVDATVNAESVGNIQASLLQQIAIETAEVSIASQPVVNVTQTGYNSLSVDIAIPLSNGTVVLIPNMDISQ